MFDRSVLIRQTPIDTLFVGNAVDARDLQQLYDAKISAVVDLAINEKPAQLAACLLRRGRLHEN